MFVRNGIAYAGEEKETLKICGVRPLDNHVLWVRFNTGEEKLFNCEYLLELAAFAPLKNPEVFRNVYIDYGTPVWNNGEIDISPEVLYSKGTAFEGFLARCDECGKAV